jgi:hypothetical protein
MIFHPMFSANTSERSSGLPDAWTFQKQRQGTMTDSPVLIPNTAGSTLVVQTSFEQSQEPDSLGNLHSHGTN